MIDQLLPLVTVLASGTMRVFPENSDESLGKKEEPAGELVAQSSTSKLMSHFRVVSSWDLVQHAYRKDVEAGKFNNFDDPENEFIAIKKLETIFEHEIYCKRTLRELKIMRLLDHPNILSIQQILEPPKRQKDFKSLYLILDQMETDLG